MDAKNLRNLVDEIVGDDKKLGSAAKAIRDAERDIYDDGSSGLLALVTLGLAGGPTVDTKTYRAVWKTARKIRESGR